MSSPPFPGPGTHVGMTVAEARQRLADDGPNEVTRGRTRSRIGKLLESLRSPLVVLLVAACAVSAFLGEYADAIAIGTLVLVNSVVGFVQENRAEHALNALRAMAAPRARVVRDGRQCVIAASDVVVGDLLVLDAGDVVAADARLIEAHALTANEAALTGESEPVTKSCTESDAGSALAEQSDRIFAGTSIASGTGRAVVEHTGMSTELGRIATLLSNVEDDATPLQVRLARLSRLLLYGCLGIVAVVAALGVVRGLTTLEVALAAVSLAVAAVPEGLPAVITIALALGVQRMAARHSLVRHLLAVETLGAATVICTDKTGTLTTGVMAVREIWGTDHRRVLEVGTACCDAELDDTGRTGIGDPTEVAILVAARARGLSRSDIESERPRLSVNPFDAERRRMSIYRSDGVLYVKGAAESVLPRCTFEQIGSMEANDDMARRGLRVLAVAVGHGPDEHRLELVGLLGIADPPRTEAIEAIALARLAGIRTVMITGDHPATALAIARELGIIEKEMDAHEVVHARATPEDKVRIVRDLKQRGEVVGMTGDGVNDAPALREAHIGIAMGRAGTEVAREAADIVLTDDNYASVISAVEEGRGIFDNIRKTVVYLISGNAGELMVMFVAALLGLPLPLLPLQLLWINLVTDGLPALALVMDPPRRNLMSQPPRSPDEPILRPAEWRQIAVTAAVQSGMTLGTFAWALENLGLDQARNLAFSVLVFGELLRAFAARDSDLPFWKIGAFTNLHLLGVVTVSVMLQLGIHHIPAAQKLFAIGELSAFDCALSLTIAAAGLMLLEGEKLLRNRRPR